MSKSSLPRELLSAYFDGEVSAEEHALVSRAVRKSPAAQQMLEDYAQLSECLQALKQNGPSPGLREEVLAVIQSSKPRPRPAESSWIQRPWMQRPWVKVAGGALAATAAAMLLLLWPAGRPVGNQGELAMEPARDAAHHSEMALARTAPAPGWEAMDMDDVAPPPELRRSPEEPAERDVREASLREESLRQFADADGIPEPGDVMNYILRVADEMVVIPVTVVDVQLTAKQIRVLLTEHGIPSLAEEDEFHDASLSEDSSMAILVESESDRVYKVMRELSTQGLVPSPAEGPLAMPLEDQDELRPEGERAELARSAVSGAAASAAVPPTTDSPVVPGESAESVTASPDHVNAADLPMIHAQLTAPVSDEFIKQLEQKQRSPFDESAATTVAEAADSDRQPDEQEAPAAEAVPKSAEIFAKPKSARRFLILIKKSGR